MMSRKKIKSAHARRRLAVQVCWLGILALPLQAQQTVDLSTENGDVRILGDKHNAFLGFAAAAGDFNDDGFEDIVLGAPNDSLSGTRPDAGKIHIIYGSSTPPALIDLSTTPADVEVHGAAQDDVIGRTLATGDVNGDNIDDLLIGAPFTDPGAVSNAGTVYIIYGSGSLPALIDLATPGDADVEIYGAASENQYGGALTTGDVNGDNTADIIAGAARATAPGGASAGKVYVTFGSGSLAATIDLSVAANVDFELQGDDFSDLLGSAVASGDVNGDGKDDLIAGAPLADPGGNSAAGEAYVIYGGTLPASPFDLNSDSPDVLLTGESAVDLAGSSLAAGDFDGDGLSDLAVAAGLADVGAVSDAGKAYIVYGDSMLASSIDLANADVVISGEDEDGGLGWRAAAVNFDGDGFDDLLISSAFSETASGTGTGKVFLLQGDPGLSSSLTVSSLDLTILGDDSGDNNGYGVAAVDINGDFIDDLLTTAAFADQTAGVDAGEAYVIIGTPPYTEVSVADTKATYLEDLIIPVRIDSTSGFKRVSVAARLAFDSALLTWNALDATGTLSDSWTFSTAITPGIGSTIDTLEFSGSGSGTTTKGIFVRIDFDVNDVRHALISPLEFTSLTFNGGQQVWTQITNGSVTLCGNDGNVETTVVSQPGDSVRVRVVDVDFNRSALTLDSLTVGIVNSNSGEVETVGLGELAVDDSVFFGILRTVFGAAAGTDNDGVINTQDGDSLFVTYSDSLDAAGATTDRLDTNFTIDPLGDADDNGVAQAFDAARILAHAVGQVVLAGRDSLAANVDLAAPYGSITSFDAALVIRKRLGIIERFPIQEDEAANHPQPETDNSVPKRATPARLVALIPAAGQLTVWAEDRSGILSGDFLLSHLLSDRAVQVRLADEWSGYAAAHIDQEGLHIAFAAERPISGPGPVLHIVLDGIKATSRVEGSFNGGEFTVALDDAAAAAASSPPTPRARLALHSNYPNPFNSSTTIRFELPEAGAVRLYLFNSLGQSVRTLLETSLAAGAHHVSWDGATDQGHIAANGLYHYILTTSGGTRSKQLILLK